jgi:CPA2 family monovalent cation:H+ antiporter-2
LDEHDFFDTDILVAAFKDDRKNAKLARIAKRHGVTRVIASQQNPKTDHRRIDELTAQGIEIYNIFNVQISVMRAMIESPSIVEMLTDTEAGLFEATVRNRRYTGQELHSLPFIDRITVSRIYRNHKPISPHGDTIIELGDHILFTGNHTDAEEVRAQLRRKN